MKGKRLLTIFKDKYPFDKIDSLLDDLKRIIESEERLKTFFEATPDIVCFKDGNGRWLEANPAILRLFRLESVDFKGNTDLELAEYSPFFKGAFLTCEYTDRLAWKKGSLSRSYEVISLPEGGERIFDVYKIPLFNKDGSRKGLVVLGRDVTDVVKSKELLQNKTRQLEVINEILSIAWEDVALKKRIDRILERLFTIYWFSLEPRAAFFLRDNVSEKFNLFSHVSLDESNDDICSEIQSGICACGKAIKEGRIIFCSGFDNHHKKECHKSKDVKEHGHYIVPITGKDGGPVGLLCLYLSKGHSQKIEEIRFLETLVKVLSEVLSYEINRSQMEAALKKGKAHLENAQRIARVGSFEIRPDLKEIWCTRQFLRLIGMDGEEEGIIKYDDFICLIDAKDKRAFEEAVDKALKKEVLVSLDLSIKPIGKSSYRDFHCELIGLTSQEETISKDMQDSDREIFISGTLQDITFFKRAKEQLELAGKIFENSIEGITITDKEGNILLVNPAFTRITGYEPEEVIGKNPRILKSDKHGPDFYRNMWQEINERGIWSGEIWNRRKTGEAYPEHLTIMAITDENDEVINYVSLFYDLSEIKKIKKSLEYQINYDALTGLPNRNLFIERLNTVISQSEKGRKRLAVLLFDIDDFRIVNEGIGYHIGDKLLQYMTRRISKCVRQKDTIARLGGDEFAVFIFNFKASEYVLEVSRRIRKALTEPFIIDGNRVRVTISVGIAFFPDDGDDAETLIRNAEIAMFHSKEKGKDATGVFSHKMNEKIKKRLMLEERLHHALEREEFFLVYQPKVGLKSGKVEGAEALIRWQSDVGLISPVDFIPIAEETGLIIPIGEWIIKEVCRQVRRWIDKGLSLHVAMNLSPRQFRDVSLVLKIKDIIEEYNIPSGAIALEITEGVVMDDEENVNKLLNKLKSLGILLAMDDFGTGYSSLYYLNKFPIDELKIDRSFVMGLPEDRDSLVINSATISLAKNLNLKTVAEGVEMKEQLEILRGLGADMVQGYYFSPPVPSDKFEEVVHKIQNNK